MKDFLQFPLMFRLAVRDLRGGLRRMWLLIFCMTLSVTMLMGVGILRDGIDRGISANAATLLGGDIRISQPYTRFTAEELSSLRQVATLSQMRDMRAMAAHGEMRTLVELKGVDAAYPLYGTLETNPPVPRTALFAHSENGHYGAAVDAALAATFGLERGDTITIGSATFEMRAIIASEPDGLSGTFSLGPRVLVSEDGFAATGLETPGSLSNHHVALKIPESMSAATAKQWIAGHFPGAPWRVQDAQDAALGVQSTLDRLSLFLSFSALAALITSGIGIANATTAYLNTRQHTVAILRCLGAQERMVIGIYALQLLMITLISAAIGVGLGSAGAAVALEFLKGALPAAHYSALPSALPIVHGLAFVLLGMAFFGLTPLLRGVQARPAVLLRGYATPLRHIRLPRSWKHSGTLAGIGVLILALAMHYTGRISMTLIFAASSTAALLLLSTIGRSLQQMAQALHPKTSRLAWRLALSGMARSGGQLSGMVASLGLGMTLMIALALVGANLERQIAQDVPKQAPTHFLIDIQPDQLPRLQEALALLGTGADAHFQPVTRGRITQLRRSAVDETTIAQDARWAVRSDRGFTSAAAAPEGTELAAGDWWPADYSGPPLISMDAKLAEGMGLAIGDRVTFSILGREIEATIHNLRRIDWSSLKMNFAIIFAPGVLEHAPRTYIATLRIAPQQERAWQQFLARDFPNVSVILLKETLEKVTRLLRQVSLAILIAASVTLLMGIAVMGGAVAASMRERIYSTVILKVLGATGAVLGRAFILEFSCITLACLWLAILLGSAAAYGIMQMMIFHHFTLLPSVVIASTLGALLVAGGIGLAVTRRALMVRPLALLRNE